MKSFTYRICVLFSCILGLAAGALPAARWLHPQIRGRRSTSAHSRDRYGKTLDTDAFNKAIEAASAAGGGTVEVPAGTYLSFSIRLKSHITLHLDQGCVIVGATEAPGFGAYDAAEPNDWGDKFQYRTSATAIFITA